MLEIQKAYDSWGKATGREFTLISKGVSGGIIAIVSIYGPGAITGGLTRALQGYRAIRIASPFLNSEYGSAATSMFFSGAGQYVGNGMDYTKIDGINVLSSGLSSKFSGTIKGISAGTVVNAGVSSVFDLSGQKGFDNTLTGEKTWASTGIDFALNLGYNNNNFGLKASSKPKFGLHTSNISGGNPYLHIGGSLGVNATRTYVNNRLQSQIKNNK